MPYQIKQGALSAHNKYLMDQLKKQEESDPIMGMAGSVVGGAIGGALGGPAGASLGASAGGSLGSKGDLSGFTPEKVAMNMATQGLGDYMGEAMDAAAVADVAAENAGTISDLGIDAASQQAKMITDQGLTFADDAASLTDAGAFKTALGSGLNTAKSGLDAVASTAKDMISPVTDAVKGAADSLTTSGQGVLAQGQDFLSSLGQPGFDPAVDDMSPMEREAYGDPMKPFSMALNRGGPVYAAEGGGFFDYIKKSFTEKPEWADDVAVQQAVTDSSGNAVTDTYGNPVTSTVYVRPKAPLAPAPEDMYGEYDDGENMGDASYLAGNPEPYSVQTYEAPRPAAKTIYKPMMSDDLEYRDIDVAHEWEPKGGVFYRAPTGIPSGGDEWTDIDNAIERQVKSKKAKPSYTPNHLYYQTPGQDTQRYKTMDEATRRLKAERAQRKAGAFNTGGKVCGPLKSAQYKSAGGEVYTQNYYDPKGK